MLAETLTLIAETDMNLKMLKIEPGPLLFPATGE